MPDTILNRETIKKKIQKSKECISPHISPRSVEKNNCIWKYFVISSNFITLNINNREPCWRLKKAAWKIWLIKRETEVLSDCQNNIWIERCYWKLINVERYEWENIFIEKFFPCFWIGSNQILILSLLRFFSAINIPMNF